MKTPEEIKKGLEYLGATNLARKVEMVKRGMIAYEYVEDAAKDALAYIRQLESQISQWIGVKERLPEDVKDGDGYCVNYLVYIPEYRSVDIANYIEEADMWVCMGVPVNVTHWMPLPVLPKEVTADDQ